MRVYHMTEQPYPDAWTLGLDSFRVTIPSELCDPEQLSGLINRYLDEWQLADELGLDVMVNEHHTTATCVSISANMTLGILARITKRARLLGLGVPITNRTDPIRVAEEMAMVDVISRGRLDMGLVKGVPYEIAPANSNPGRMMDRFWESHDLILKAMTTHDGPFNWEGEYHHYRQVNVWPRPYQQPHPPVWITSLNPANAVGIAQRGHVIATVLSGLACKTLFESYRQAYLAAHGRPAPLDRLAYAMMCTVATTRAEAYRKAELVGEYIRTAGIVAAPFNMPPGYASTPMMAKILKNGGQLGYQPVQTFTGKLINPITASTEELIESGQMVAGTPDEVFDQIVNFQQHVGGFGNLIAMFQAGALNHRDTTDSITLFGTEVLPRLKQWAAEQQHQTTPQPAMA